MLEELCKRIQHCCASLRPSRNKRDFGICWLKSLTGFILCATTPNKQETTYIDMQLDSVCKRTQHVTYNNVSSACKGFESLYNWEFQRTPLETENMKISIIKWLVSLILSQIRSILITINSTPSAIHLTSKSLVRELFQITSSSPFT